MPNPDASVERLLCRLHMRDPMPKPTETQKFSFFRISRSMKIQIAYLCLLCLAEGATTDTDMQVHVAVAGTETDHLAKLINEKAEELDAACIVMASHGKTGFQVN